MNFTTSRSLRRMIFLFVILIVSASKIASATDLIFMHIPEIPGESLFRGYEGWIQVTSFSGNATSPDASSGSGQMQQSKACQLAITKQLDIAGPRLWAATVTGKKFPTVRIQVVALEGAVTNFVFYDILLTNSQVTTIADSGSTSTPTENLTFTAASVTLTFTPQNADGSPGTPVKSSFACD